MAAAEKAPRELLALPDADLLRGLGCLSGDQLTRAGLLLCGTPDAIRAVFPGYVWTFLRMDSDTAYSDRHDGSDALPVALAHFEERIALANPIRTLEAGLVHAEIRAYPPIALREALLNALCHADFRLPGPILIKQFPSRLEISNPGTFVGGISSTNILHHPPVPRNPALVDALAKLRLVNRSNLGIGRMFEAFLIDGKEPPVIQESGETIIVTMLKQDLSAPFRAFVTEQANQGRLPGVDELLVLQYLTRHTELETSLAAELCQRPDTTMRNTLSRMERDYGWIERGGTGRGTYWTLSLPLARSLRPDGLQESVTRIDWESAKTRVLSMLKQRATSDLPGMSNAEIRSVLKFHRNQVFKLLQELRTETPQVITTGHGAGARYEWKPE
jgi:ATP-dependent DNA helicase RecG